MFLTQFLTQNYCMTSDEFEYSPQMFLLFCFGIYMQTFLHFQNPFVEYKGSVNVKGSSWNQMPIKNFYFYDLHRMEQMSTFLLCKEIKSYMCAMT